MNRNLWVENLFRPLVIGAMVGCVALSLGGLARLFFPAWDATYLVVGCVLAAVEANYSYRLIRARPQRATDVLGTDALRFRLIELMLIFILLKIGSYLDDSWAGVLADIQTWPLHPLAVVDLETIAAFLLVFFCWFTATQTVRDLERFNEPPEHIDRNYVSPMDSLTGRFFFGGIALLVITGLTQVGIANLLNLRRPSVPGLVLNALVYFLLGLVMLGQVRFITLRKQWQAQGIKVADELAGRWVRYSLVFISLAAFLAFLLPTGYTAGLLDTAGFALNLVAMVLWFVGSLLLLLITFPFAWLLWLLSKLMGSDIPIVRRRLSPLQFAQQTPGSVAPNWFEMLRSLIFWIVVLGMIFYVVRGYLRDRPELLEALGALGPIRVLRRLWAGLWHWWGRWTKAVSERLISMAPSGLMRRRSSEESAPFFRLGALSPRERVLYYYLSILRRAGQQGFPRRRDQTPYEYDATLGPNLPEAQQEMALLTQTFVEARYSRQAIEPDHARRARTAWQWVKAALHALKQRASGGT